MANRMVTENHLAYRKMLQLRRQRKEFVNDEDMGVFYRNQKLLSGIRTGDITEDNVDEYMDAQKLSEDMIPMDWYHLECFPHPQDIHDSLLVQNLITSKKNTIKEGVSQSLG